MRWHRRESRTLWRGGCALGSKTRHRTAKKRHTLFTFLDEVANKGDTLRRLQLGDVAWEDGPRGGLRVPASKMKCGRASIKGLTPASTRERAGLDGYATLS